MSGLRQTANHKFAKKSPLQSKPYYCVGTLQCYFLTSSGLRPHQITKEKTTKLRNLFLDETG